MKSPLVMRFARYFVLLVACNLWSQDDFLAKQYFSDGAFDKAVVFYEKLVAANPGRSDYAENLVNCYQQLQSYDKAVDFLKSRINTGTAYPSVYIDLGYTYLLMGQASESDAWYRKALEAIDANPNVGYGIGFKFQRYTLLDYALTAYRRSMELNPDLDFSFQIAQIYGEQGRITEMFDAYMDLMATRPTAKQNVMRALEAFIDADPQAENNQLLRRVLLGRAQRSPDPVWNELLSWLMVLQGQYDAAFSQEKAIFRRVPEASLDRIIELGRMAEEEGQLGAADQAYAFVISESRDSVSRLNARLHRIDIDLRLRPGKAVPDARKAYEDLLASYGYATETIQLQVAYANFLAFQDNQPERAIDVLKKSLELPLSDYSQGYLKLNLGDILVFDERFNEALILFSQVQKTLKNDVMGQQARYKVAQASFYKGDFEWALTQLKVLRNSTSQLIANDAMQLSLIISDNSLEDSTQTALRKYARADLLAYQKKDAEAIAALEEILTQHKGEAIEDEALLMHARLLEARGDFTGALLSYRKIVEFYGSDILADDAHFALAELYRTRLGEPEKAMEHYLEILYQFQDSYYFPQARKQFRALRGDPVN